MNKIKAVLFDVIGTTVLENDPELINNCFQKAFFQNSIVVSKTDILNVRGKDKLEAIEQILRSTSNPLALSRPIFEEFKKAVTVEVETFREHPEFQAVLNILQINNVKVGVGSGLPSSVFDILFEHLEWERYKFDYVAVFENFKNGRPDPVMVLDMCRKINIPPHNLLKVGDTASDVLEGKNASALTAVILSGTQPKDQLVATGPDYMFDSLYELTSLF